MTPRIETLRSFIRAEKHHEFRHTPEELGLDRMNEKFREEGVSPVTRSARMLKTLLEAEAPIIIEGESIVATRTITRIPSIFTDEEWEDIRSKHTLHERGTVSNLSADYEGIIADGLGKRKESIEARLTDETLTAEQKEFLAAAKESIEAVQSFILKYQACAKNAGLDNVAEVLGAIHSNGATTLHEALQLLRIVHFALWESDCYHNTLGRFDQYMYPYYKSDIEKGTLTEEQAYELIMEFFLACNKDSDLYVGMQQGDNGQSLVLGGRDAEGNCLFNDVSRMCLKASYELNLIDPKINLRCDSNTPLEIYQLGAELTKRGLGFPQYDNDDVVIPGLMKLGYSEEDAHNYVVAACWEFIIPKNGMEIPNIDALSFAEIVSNAVNSLGNYDSYESFYAYIVEKINEECERITSAHDNLYFAPAPFLSTIMGGTIEKAKDISEGGNSNNYGVHGTGLSTAADSLAAIKKFYFEEKSVSLEELTDALKNNFAGHEQLQERLRNEAPKMGVDNDEADSIGCALLNSFAEGLRGKRNERGGIWRAGTGTAMYYIFHAKDLPATPDGRNAGEVLPANFTPSMFLKQKGPVSVMRSFSKPNLQDAINGGPLTIELDESIFRNDETVEKLAMLIRSYIRMGGHQLQLNTLNREKLLDAKAHPELHKNLIVRVWGWSGYFVELDECYQDHIIERIKYKI
ncbi:MAG: pyruvate formate-lyase [Bacteroidaceae bacterium]|nr:pyruvate formate-lyase [Bacteroidaceae bacterium]